MSTMGTKPTVTLRRVIFLLILTAIVVGAHLLPAFSSSAVANELRNSLHIIGFAVIGGVVFESLHLSIVRRIVVTLVIVAVIGFLSELIQSKFQELDTGDLVRDIAGAVIFICSRLLWRRAENSESRQKTLRVASVLVGFMIFAPLLYWLSIYGSYVTRFPVVLDAEVPTDRLLLDPFASNMNVIDSDGFNGAFDGSVVEIELLRPGWSGVRILPVISDWSDYQTLSFRVAMVGGTQPRFEVRLGDGLHPGFRPNHYVGRGTAGAEPKTVRFPLQEEGSVPGRPELDLRHILELHIVGKDEQAGTFLYLDDFRLE